MPQDAPILFRQPAPTVNSYLVAGWVPANDLIKSGPQPINTLMKNHLPRVDNFQTAYADYKLSHYEPPRTRQGHEGFWQQAWFASDPLDFKDSTCGFIQPIPGIAIYSVYAWVNAHQLNAVGPNAFGTLMTGHNPAIVNDGLSAWSAYKLSHYDEPSQRPGHEGTWQKAWFAPDRAASKNTVVRTDYEYEEGRVVWPPVVNSIKLLGGAFTGSGAGDNDGSANTSVELFDVVIGGGTATAGGYTVPPDMPAVDVGYLRDRYSGVTKFKIEMYLSDTQYDLSSAPTLAHYARTAHFDRHVISLTLQETLHDEFIVPPMDIELTGGGIEKSFPSTTIAATSPTDWIDHVHQQGQKQIGALWLKTVVTAIVPTF